MTLNVLRIKNLPQVKKMSSEWATLKVPCLSLHCEDIRIGSPTQGVAHRWPSRRLEPGWEAAWSVEGILHPDCHHFLSLQRPGGDWHMMGDRWPSRSLKLKQIICFSALKQSSWMNTEMHIISKLSDAYGVFPSLLLYSMNIFWMTDYWECCSTSLNSFCYSLYAYMITLCCEMLMIKVSEQGMQTNIGSLGKKSFIKQQTKGTHGSNNQNKLRNNHKVSAEEPDMAQMTAIKLRNCKDRG